MPSIKASVGIHSGKQCYNVVADQQVVIGLLNRVSMSNGGTREQPLDASPRWGMCSPALQKAILRFQAIYSLSQDGHVDPGGQTIRRMNQAAGDVLQGGPGAVGKKGAGVAGNYPEPWYVDSLSLSGVSVINDVGGGAYRGSISVVNADSGEFTFAIMGGGVAVGISDGVPKSVLGAAVNTLTSSLGGSLANLDSDTSGVCIPMRGGLNRTSFNGSCLGMFIGEGLTIYGASQWALFFGMPGAYFDTGVGLVMPMAQMLYHAQGVAFISSKGMSLNLSVGVAANQFAGRIG